MAAIDMPGTPQEGETYPASNGVTYLWDGEKWTATAADVDVATGISVGETPPASPGQGFLWYNTVDGILYVWYTDESQNAGLGEGQWVDIRPGNDSDTN